MKIFTGGDKDHLKSTLCESCLEKVKDQFEKDEKGHITLIGERPELCEDCKKKMKDQFSRSVYPDRE